MGKQASLTCTADDPLYFLFLPWTSLPVFPGFGNTPSLFLTSCGRNPADPEEAAPSFQSAAPGISVAQQVELGSLTRETHIHSGQWKQINWVLSVKIINTPVYLSPMATPAGAGFQVPGWDTAVAALTSATTCLMLSIIPPAVSQRAMAGAQDSAWLRWVSIFLSHSPSGLWHWHNIQLRSDLLAQGGAALKNGWINKHPLGQDQPADCQVFYHHVHHRNNLVINPRGITHCNCTQVRFYICSISARMRTGVLHTHLTTFDSKYRGKHVPIFRDNYSKICTRFQRL